MKTGAGLAVTFVRSTRSAQNGQKSMNFSDTWNGMLGYLWTNLPYPSLVAGERNGSTDTPELDELVKLTG
jgi:hypothetical protein